MIYFRNEKRYDFILVLVLTIIFLISFYSISFSSALKIGFPAPSFSLNTIEEGTFDLGEYKEKQKLLILYFYSPDNQDSLAGVKELAQYFEDHITQEKYEIFIINTQENLQKEGLDLIKKYLSDNKVPFTLLLDDQKMVSKLYNIEILPTAIFLDANLIVKRVYPGFILSQQTLMFQYINYLLDSSERNISKKEKKDKKPIGDEGLAEEGESTVDEEPIGDEELPACCSSKSLNL
ncbi:peroxiredoxin family protein [bacterium]|nr:peroxiredoxin family protein [bacterium]MBU4361353.1 peroxiredoxin family protein [bacterium]MCG2761907.1 peroxiredoxin family protein [Candidatus Atribacteria bacterium]